MTATTASLIDRMPACRGRLTAAAPLANVTWFRVGGPAEVMFRPEDAEDLAGFLAGLPDDVPVTVLGVASNLLIRDGGIPGVVIRLGRGFAGIAADGLTLEAGAAALDLNVAAVAGFAAAKGRYVVMADADLTYDFGEIPRFLEELENGADLVMGDRMDGIQPGAMPWMHRYIGNPALSGILNFFFKTGIRDAHCGMRALRRDILPRLDLRTPGMEFASEMVIRASKEDLDIRELPIHYHPRGGESKLSTFRDGWRHLRFLLAFSPRWLLLYPSMLFQAVGLAGMLWLLLGPRAVGRVVFDVHTMLAFATMFVLGVQGLGLAVIARSYAAHLGLLRQSPGLVRVLVRVSLERGLALGGVLLLGIALAVRFDPTGLESPVTALPIQIFYLTSQSQESYQQAASAAIVVLLVLVLSLNGLAIFIRNKFQRSW